MIAWLLGLLRPGPSAAMRARIADLADDVQPPDPRPEALSAALVAARLDRVTRPAEQGKQGFDPADWLPEKWGARR